MRKLAVAATSMLVFSALVLVRAEADKGAEAKVRLRLVDEGTGKAIAGLVRVFREGDDKPLSLPRLPDRLRGLGKEAKPGGWHAAPARGGDTTLPRARLRVEAFSGLETALATQEVDLTREGTDEVVARVEFLFRPEEDKLYAGNPHLHLRDMTLEQADDYLREIPAADGLKVLFISYLERLKDDEHYVTNRYPIGRLKAFDATGVLVSNGEEHRHNFEAYGPGYGHVMFLDINQLVKPVSLGPGITGAGDDDRTLVPGIEDARKQGGTVIWCHNTFGYESAPAAVAGQLDAFNVFDGSTEGTYENRYYRFLNVGLRLPLSTGTDWFLYDFARVYARVPDQLTVPNWLAALKSGRCVATNGPMLTLSVDGRAVGDVIQCDKPRKVRIDASGIGRHDFGRLELVQNGRVIQGETATKKVGGYSARLEREVQIDEPAWFAVRIDSQTRNELGRKLYAHTSPVYVDLAGKRVFDIESARNLQRQLETARDAIRQRGSFSTPQARDKVLALYDQAEKEIVERINKRGK
jgi:hypothetical protein